MELAQRIRNRRLDQRLTIEDVAAQAGLTRSWLSKVENFRVYAISSRIRKDRQGVGHIHFRAVWRAGRYTGARPHSQ